MWSNEAQPQPKFLKRKPLKKMESYMALHFSKYGRDLVFVLGDCYIGLVSFWFQLNVTPFSHR